MCSYLDMAKRGRERDKAASRHARSFGDAGRDQHPAPKQTEFSLAVQWATEPGWIALRDPTTGEWHEVRASECLPSIVREAEAKRIKGPKRKTTKENR